MSSVLCMNEVDLTLGAFHFGPVTLELASNELMCLVGPNGAGKTTLINLALGLRSADGGSVTVLGGDPSEASRRCMAAVGYVPDDPTMLVEELTAGEYWALVAGLVERADRRRPAAASTDRAHTLAAQLGFDPKRQRIAGFSHGMRKQTQIVAALATAPDLLVLDEPHNGLDPIVSRIVDRLIVEAAGQGTAVLAATHDLLWADRIASRVAIVSGGQLIADGEPSALKACPDEGLDEAFFRLVE